MKALATCLQARPAPLLALLTTGLNIPYVGNYIISQSATGALAALLLRHKPVGCGCMSMWCASVLHNASGRQALPLAEPQSAGPSEICARVSPIQLGTKYGMIVSV
jgi:hypothetical protein